MSWSNGEHHPRLRVISDNDYFGDPDGIVQLAHHLLCDSVEIVGVIGGHLHELDPTATETSAEDSAVRAREVAALAGRADVRIVAGANQPMADAHTPALSAGASLIVEEAMRDDTDLPLTVVAGGALTQLATALLLEPAIADRMKVIWIGGPEYPELCEPRSALTPMETNLWMDPAAAHVVFTSTVPLWQFPRNVYSQVLSTRDELRVRMQPTGELGAYLYDRLSSGLAELEGYGFRVGEGYGLGDSPLVLATALTARMGDDPASCAWVTRPRCSFAADGSYDTSHQGAPMRIFTRVDARVILEDLFAKLTLHET